MPTSPRRAAVSISVLLCALAGGCDCGSHRASTIATKPRAVALPSAKPFVVFRDRTFFIGQLEVPVSPPVTVGSSPSPATMSSDAPDVVSVEQSGALVAHRAGSTLVRATDTGSLLEVEVRNAGTLRAIPGKLELRDEQEAPVRIVTRDGSVVPPQAVSWATSAPDVATVSNGIVRAGARAGSARIVAQYGTTRAAIPVKVTLGSTPAFSIRPAKPTVRAGETLSFQALSPAGTILADWTSSNPRVAMYLGGSMFRGGAHGDALVCATHAARRSCTTLTVKR